MCFIYKRVCIQEFTPSHKTQNELVPVCETNINNRAAKEHNAHGKLGICVYTSGKEEQIRLIQALYIDISESVV